MAGATAVTLPTRQYPHHDHPTVALRWQGWREVYVTCPPGFLVTGCGFGVYRSDVTHSSLAHARNIVTTGVAGAALLAIVAGCID